ncbi:MAG: peptide chain release factor 1 [Alphaproteobacteria bacterium]|nr:peptide chain release factor 1 [Alphaproteobacteria bacterium]
MSLDENLNRVLSRYDELQALMSAEEVPAADEIARLSKEFSDLTPVVQAVNELKSARDEAFDLAVMVEAEEDVELRELADVELQELKDRVPELERQVQLMLLPKDEVDSKSAILEVRAGTGGDEAALFAADLFRMYQRYAETRGWKFELMSANEIGIGGYKEVVASVSGKEVFLRLKFESGVHRVQRVPVTESGGRIHTSAATVAVMPEAEEVDVHVDEKDLRIDVFRASGPGGQSVNTTDSAVRITHIPTGIVVSQQDEKSQHKNKAKAMRVLRARLYEAERAAKDAERAEARRSQVGSGDRSERIRTYNFPERRVTDHRINLTLHQLDKMLDGDLDEVVDALLMDDQARQLSELA